MNFTNIPFLNVLLTVIYAVAVILLFNLANIYFLKKININKWVMLAVAVGSLALALFLVINDPRGLWHLIPLTISLAAFMWFMDLRRKDKTRSRKAEKKIVNKPKPNPRRARMVEESDKTKPSAATPEAKPGRKK